MFAPPLWASNTHQPKLLHSVTLCMDYPHRRVVTVRTSCSNQAVMYSVLSPLACHTMCWHLPTDDVGNPYSNSVHCILHTSLVVSAGVDTVVDEEYAAIVVEEKVCFV